MQVAYEISQRRACATLRCNRTVMRYESIRDPQDALIMRMREITSVRTSWGSRRVHVLLQREGWHVNHKRIRRLYRLEGLNLRCKTPRRRKSIVTRSEAVKATRRDERWSMDFMADQLHDGLRKVSLDFSRPGKPTDNAFIESFNARVRAKYLNAHVFESLEDAKNILTNWRSDYNKFRPHSALGMLTPEEFAALSQRNEVPVNQNFST